MRKGLARFNDVAAPVNTEPPSVSEKLSPKTTTTCEPGQWSSEATTTYSYQWLVDGLKVAESQTLWVSSDYVGAVVTCRVTAQNFAGSQSATSPGVTVGGNFSPAVIEPRFTARLMSKRLDSVIRSGRLRMSVYGSDPGTVHVRVLTTGMKMLALAKGSLTLAGGRERLTLGVRKAARNALARRLRDADIHTVALRLIVTGESVSGTPARKHRMTGVLRRAPKRR